VQLSKKIQHNASSILPQTLRLSINALPTNANCRLHVGYGICCTPQNVTHKNMQVLLTTQLNISTLLRAINYSENRTTLWDFHRKVQIHSLRILLWNDRHVPKQKDGQFTLTGDFSAIFNIKFLFAVLRGPSLRSSPYHVSRTVNLTNIKGSTLLQTCCAPVESGRRDGRWLHRFPLTGNLRSASYYTVPTSLQDLNIFYCL
jgi:hypothetical protein